MAYRLIPTWIERIVLTHSWLIVFICLIGSQLVSSYVEGYGYVAAFLWKVSGVCIGAWLGNIIYIKYHCNGKPEECMTAETHRLYFILGICAIFGLR